MTTVSNIQLSPPVRVEVAIGTTRIISFPNEFFGVAHAIQIINNDGANAITYRYGGSSMPLQSIPASSIRAIDGATVKLLEINAGAGGTTSVEAQITLDPRTKNAIPESII